MNDLDEIVESGGDQQNLLAIKVLLGGASTTIIFLLGILGYLADKGVNEFQEMNATLASLGEWKAAHDVRMTDMRRDVDKLDVRVIKLEDKIK